MMVDLKGYEGKYKINESGVIINKKGHKMRSAVSNSGYLRVALEEKDSTHRKNESVHRLVAKQFIPNPDNLPVVMHKDNDPLNNHVSNLQWGTSSDNIQQAIREGRFKPHGRFNWGFVYEVYNTETNDIKRCVGREAVADLIQYEEISLKNMIGNGRKIALGPYSGYEIRRTLLKKKKGSIEEPFVKI